jgi:hypothetical protein
MRYLSLINTWGVTIYPPYPHSSLLHSQNTQDAVPAPKGTKSRPQPSSRRAPMIPATPITARHLRRPTATNEPLMSSVTSSSFSLFKPCRKIVHRSAQTAISGELPAACRSAPPQAGCAPPPFARKPPGPPDLGSMAEIA